MSKAFTFTLKKTDPSGARRGVFKTTHSEVETPVFMPVGTQGTVKAMLPEQVADMGARIVLGNTYHLLLKPGPDIIKAHGGLHTFMNWDGSILTDSGGFQIFSLSGLRKLDDDGVTFRSPIDGALVRLTPEKAIDVQQALGSDIAMVLDVCPPADGPKKDILRAMELSTAWARRCQDHRSLDTQAVFGIVQGGTHADLRQQHAEQICGLDFDGFAIGGLSVGETNEEMYATLNVTTPCMPADKPRYLMGVGTPEDLVEGVMRGVDMFDCVLPTRTARTGKLYTHQGELVIKHSEYREDLHPVDPLCDCYTCRNYSRSYLRHLYTSKEILASILNTTHNLHYFINLMKDIRQAIDDDRFMQFRAEFYALRGKTPPVI